jgi:hypothetical protein
MIMKESSKKALKKEWEYFLSDLGIGWEGGSKNPLAYVFAAMFSILTVVAYVVYVIIKPFSIPRNAGVKKA